MRTEVLTLSAALAPGGQANPADVSPITGTIRTIVFDFPNAAGAIGLVDLSLGSSRGSVPATGVMTGNANPIVLSVVIPIKQARPGKRCPQQPVGSGGRGLGDFCHR